MVKYDFGYQIISALYYVLHPAYKKVSINRSLTLPSCKILLEILLRSVICQSETYYYQSSLPVSFYHRKVCARGFSGFSREISANFDGGNRSKRDFRQSLLIYFHIFTGNGVETRRSIGGRLGEIRKVSTETRRGRISTFQESSDHVCFSVREGSFFVFVWIGFRDICFVFSFY